MRIERITHAALELSSPTRMERYLRFDVVRQRPALELKILCAARTDVDAEHAARDELVRGNKVSGELFLGGREEQFGTVV